MPAVLAFLAKLFVQSLGTKLAEVVAHEALCKVGKDCPAKIAEIKEKAEAQVNALQELKNL